ncbi:MAG: hypothetical protein HY231_22275 [Acidobacteria bacterium]|nr:hypothetical protein [Acidobacteriota bacterium]
MIGKFLAWLFWITFLFCLNASAQTADELIGKHIEARGGLQKIKAVRSIKTTGKLVEQNMSFPFTIYQKRPALFRFDADIQGKILTLAYNGEMGWKIDPFQANPELIRMAGAELREAQEQADLDGALVDYQEKGHRVEFLGKEEVGGSAVYKLKLSLKNGDEQTIYLDCHSYLEVKTIALKITPAGEMEVEIYKRDYKMVNGLAWAHSIETRIRKQSLYTQLIDQVEIDLAIDSAVFKMPVEAQEKKSSGH